MLALMLFLYRKLNFQQANLKENKEDYRFQKIFTHNLLSAYKQSFPMAKFMVTLTQKKDEHDYSSFVCIYPFVLP
jgi:hypothetical protein